jgi:predicted dehydrogenase
MVMTEKQVAHDTVPHFMQRFAEAYPAQLEDFAGSVLSGKPPSITLADGIEALRVALAATRSFHAGQPVEVASIA